MMTINHNNHRMNCSGNRGFSLIELMVVVAILGILAAAVGVHINSDDAKLRSFSFNLASRVKQAKFEAMKRGRTVCLDFDENSDGIINNYAIWVDNITASTVAYDRWDPAVNDINGNGVCDANEGDCLIGNIAPFESGMEIYNAADATITGGPQDPNAGSGDADITDGLKTGANTWFMFKPGGDSTGASIYLYFPRRVTGGKEVSAGPLAIVVNSVGRITVDEWVTAKTWKKDNS